MRSSGPSYRFVRQSPISGGTAASSLGVVLNYDGREVRLSISIGRPINGAEAEEELVLAELKRLQNALQAILT